MVQWYSVPVPGQEAADVKATWFTLSVPELGVKQKQNVSFLCSPLKLVKVKSCLYQLFKVLPISSNSQIRVRVCGAGD